MSNDVVQNAMGPYAFRREFKPPVIDENVESHVCRIRIFTWPDIAAVSILLVTDNGIVATGSHTPQTAEKFDYEEGARQAYAHAVADIAEKIRSWQPVTLPTLPSGIADASFDDMLKARGKA